MGAWVAAALLLPGLLLVLPGGPVPEGHARAALLLALAAVAGMALPPLAAPRLALLGSALALLTGFGLATHPRLYLDLASGRGLTFLLPALWIPLAAIHHAHAPARRTSLALLGGAAVATGIWVLVDRATGRPPVGPFGRTGVTGPVLAALIPCLAVLDARWLAARSPALRALPFALVAAGLLATTSRTSWAAAAVGALVWAGARATTAGGARRALLGAGGLAAAGVLLVALSVAGLLPGGSWVGRGDTIRVRLGLWRASARLLAEAPLAGHGQGSFPAAILERRDLEEARISRGRRPLEAHSDVAHHAVEGGVPAALALVLLAGGAAFLAWRRARRAGGEGRAILAACAGGLAALAAAAVAENPFLEPPTAAVFGVLAGTALSVGVPAMRGTRLGARVVAAVVGLLVLVAAARLAQVAVADAQVARDDWALPPAEIDGILAGPPSEGGIEQITQAAPGVRAHARHPAGAYRLATRFARAGWLDAAREAWRRVLEADPGATEARLDTAETYRLEGRDDLARETLLEAGRHDPTRVDVPLRLGHLLLGPEAPPSRASPPPDPLRILRHYNDAATLAPDRFEVDVAYARVHRRRGDRKAAGVALREAKAKAERIGPGVPGEVLVESFRLAEAEGAPSRAATGILALALEASPPAVAAEIRREADACALAADAGGRTGPADARAVRADFEAAVRRYSALAMTRRTDLATLRAEAGAHAEAGRDRAALAVYVGLLADPFAAPDTDLVLEARAVAARVDPDVAEALAIRGRTLLGFEALARGDAPGAETQFRIAISKDANGVAAHYGLAKALARQGRREESAAALARARGIDASVADRAAEDPDLRGIR